MDIFATEIEIVEMKGEPQYTGKRGRITRIDDGFQLHGTWGGCALINKEDIFKIITDNKVLKEIHFSEFEDFVAYSKEFERVKECVPGVLAYNNQSLRRNQFYTDLYEIFKKYFNNYFIIRDDTEGSRMLFLKKDLDLDSVKFELYEALDGLFRINVNISKSFTGNFHIDVRKEKLKDSKNEMPQVYVRYMKVIKNRMEDYERILDEYKKIYNSFTDEDKLLAEVSDG